MISDGWLKHKNMKTELNNTDYDDIIHKIHSMEKQIELLTIRINEPLNKENNNFKEISKKEYDLMNMYRNLKEFLEFIVNAEVERMQHDISTTMLQQAFINERLTKVEKELEIIKKKQI